MELFRPDAGLFFWMALTFGVVLFLLWRYAWPSIIGAIDERERYISESISAADEALKKLKDIEQEGIDLLAKAHEEQMHILHEGKAIKDKTIDEAKHIAREEAEKIMEDARRTIQREWDEAQNSIYRQAAELSIVLAEKILRRELSNKTDQNELIDRMVEELKVKES